MLMLHLVVPCIRLLQPSNQHANRTPGNTSNSSGRGCPPAILRVAASAVFAKCLHLLGTMIVVKLAQVFLRGLRVSNPKPLNPRLWLVFRQTRTRQAATLNFNGFRGLGFRVQGSGTKPLK